MKLIPSSKKDYEFFYELLKERDLKINISHKKLPTREDSDKFNGDRPYSKDFVIMMKEERIGRIYITYDGELGIFLSFKYQNYGLGGEVLKMFIKKVKEKKYYANVSPLNTKSQRFFERNGFKLVQYTYVKEIK